MLTSWKPVINILWCWVRTIISVKCDVKNAKKKAARCRCKIDQCGKMCAKSKDTFDFIQNILLGQWKKANAEASKQLTTITDENKVFGKQPQRDYSWRRLKSEHKHHDLIWAFTYFKELRKSLDNHAWIKTDRLALFPDRIELSSQDQSFTLNRIFLCSLPGSACMRVCVFVFVLFQFS